MGVDTSQAGSEARAASGRAMPMDVYRKDDKYVVEMELPGIRPDDIDLSVERNTLTVSAESTSTHEDADEQVLCERRHVRYMRQLYLGENVDAEHLQATCDHGLLRIEIPIAKRQQARRVEVKAGNPTEHGG